MNILELSRELEAQVNQRITSIHELQKQAYNHYQEIDKLMAQTKELIAELKPVEYIVFAQNPLFEAMFRELEDPTPKEVTKRTKK